MTRWVIAYDITDDGRRTRIADALLARGDRVQFSVYEIELTPTLLAGLVDELADKLDELADTLRVYRICSACARESITLGTSDNADGDWVF